MKKIPIAGLLLACSLTEVASAVEPIQLFVMAGQSNMLGSRGDARQYPGEQALRSSVDKSIAFYWDVPDAKNTMDGRKRQGSQGWGTLGPQSINFGKDVRDIFGPEVTFARAARRDRSEVGVFKYSLGGTSLGTDWRGPGAGGMYDDFMASFSQAYGSLVRLGHPVDVKGLIFVHGESDAETVVNSARYQFRMKTLIQHFRNATGYRNLPVVLSVNDEAPPFKKNKEVIEAQIKLAGEEACVAFVSTKSLPKADDRFHLTPKGVAAHGAMLYEAWKKLASRTECQS